MVLGLLEREASAMSTHDMNRDHRGRFTYSLSDQERFANRVHKLLACGYSVDRAERQTADELKLWHMIEMDEDIEPGDLIPRDYA